MNVTKALAESCDVFFYQVGQMLGVDKIAKHADACGFGRPTGIKLDKEANGLVPTSAWKMERTELPWQGGDTLSVAIGQSYNLATPIQTLVLAAAVANGGKRYQPLVMSAVKSAQGETLDQSTSQVVGRLSASDETLGIIREGLWQAVNSPTGTAYGAKLESIEMAGKTGTAQVISRKSDEDEPAKELVELQRAHAWFVAYAPADAAEIAVTVIVEHGESGSSAAAPIASDLIQFYFENR